MEGQPRADEVYMLAAVCCVTVRQLICVMGCLSDVAECICFKAAVEESEQHLRHVMTPLRHMLSCMPRQPVFCSTSLLFVAA